MDDDPGPLAIALGGGLGHDLRIVVPEEPGRGILDRSHELGNVGLARRVGRRARAEPAAPEVPRGPRHREVQAKLERPEERGAAVGSSDGMLYRRPPIGAAFAIVGHDGPAILADEENAL